MAILGNNSSFQFGISEVGKAVEFNGAKALVQEVRITQQVGEFSTVDIKLIVPLGLKIDDAIRQPQVITAVEEKLRQITYED